MLGMLSHPHHEQFVPKFCKRYADVGHSIQEGLQKFRADVESGIFPGQDYSPYKMAETERALFEDLLARDAKERRERLSEVHERYVDNDEYEKLHLYGKNGGGGIANGGSDPSSTS
jgi:3-methyl-2-oxobutanoate hydroxymethyltransferase